MATDSSLELNLLEKIGDRFTSATEWALHFVTRMFGSSNERFIRSLGYIAPQNVKTPPTIVAGSLLQQVNSLEERTRALSDEELRGSAARFREKLAQGATLDDILVESFAACREAARRTKNMRHFDVQILGGIILHRGNIAEMMTGEGKTLVATLPAVLNCLTGKGVHIVTVNDYLARRDCEWMLPIYKAVGATAGYIQSDMDPVARRAAYDCDITYGTNSEFGFDYLRDNMKSAHWGDPDYPAFLHQCQRALNYAIIDEVDNILIDEARTPLIISGPAHSDVRRFARANDVAVKLTELQKSEPGKYFEVKEKEHTCHLTDEGVRKAEELAGVESFYTAGNMEWPHLIDNSLKAHHLYKKDKQYAVMRHPESNELSVIIIDEFTGRLMIGRQWSDGLHQAVEAKHARDGVKIKEETQTLATITLQNFFKLYKKLSGMTGTAMTEANEFWKIYKLDVIAVPTNRPLIRVNHADVVFRSEKEKWTAVVEEIAEVTKSGRPILIGTTDVDKSLKLSEMLKRRGVRHELLNALPEHAAREAEIVAQAGRIGAVTISTNMAGRGTDIILGGNPETMAWSILRHKYATRLDVPEDEWKQIIDEIEAKEKTKDEGRKVAQMGGLHIVGTERHEARRIDNQLRGRAGRQGDPGSSRFYLSLQDDLMRVFGGEWVANLLGKMGMEEGQSIESRMVSRRIEAAQRKREEHNFDIRKHLLEYDEVMDYQRKRVYGYRQEILEGANCKVRILRMIDDQIKGSVDRFLGSGYGAACFAEFAANRLGIEFDAADFNRSDFEQAESTAREKAVRRIPDQMIEWIEEDLGPEDEKEWNWQALSSKLNARWGLKTNDRTLRQLGKDNIVSGLIDDAARSVDQVDLSEGKPFLEPTWGLQSISDWTRLKFQLALPVAELQNRNEKDIKGLIRARVLELYHQKEVEFPVQVAMARFMADRTAPAAQGGQKYDREGLFRWAKDRFPAMQAELREDDFRTFSRNQLRELLAGVSKRTFPAATHADIDARLAEALRGARVSEAADAQEIAEWARKELGLPIDEARLTGIDEEQARNLLWNAFDERYRPEMRRMERNLVLSQLDGAWKSHLYTMDHLRSSVSMRWVGQLDPKIEYKREGMKAFNAMWDGVHDKVTDSVFRMEEAEGFQETLWQISAVVHESAPPPPRGGMRGEQEQAMANNKEGKKAEPIRNRNDKVGRNDPCPCGSGKKYKNCHMKQAV
jgi:preprotein translocase subunit SecA